MRFYYKNFALWKSLLREWKGQIQIGKHIFKWYVWQRIISRIYEELKTTIRKQTTRTKINEEKFWTEISPKKICDWMIKTWKDAQHYLPLGYQKLKPGATTTHPLEWQNKTTKQRSKQNPIIIKCWPGCQTTGIHW